MAEFNAERTIALGTGDLALVGRRTKKKMRRKK